MISAQQRRLSVELAVWIAERVRQLGEFTESPVGAIFNSAGSPFAGAFYTLWSLNCATVTDAKGNAPRDEGHGAPPPHFRLATEREIRSSIANREIWPKHFSELVRDFVRLLEYSREAFQLTGDWFRPGLPQPLLEAFVAAGFLECHHDQCRWLEAMAERIEWTTPKHSWENEDEAQTRRLRKYAPIWNSIPLWLREKAVYHGKLDRLALPDIIRRFWNGESWQSEQLSVWSDQKRLIEAMHIADEIQRLINAGRLTL
jgi:hypothetical protein